MRLKAKRFLFILTNNHAEIGQIILGVCVPRPSAQGPYPQPSTLGLSALDPHLVGPRSQNIARLNTILLLNFEVAITLKL